MDWARKKWCRVTSGAGAGSHRLETSYNTRSYNSSPKKQRNRISTSSDPIMTTLDDPGIIRRADVMTLHVLSSSEYLHAEPYYVPVNRDHTLTRVNPLYPPKRAAMYRRLHFSACSFVDWDHREYAIYPSSVPVPICYRASSLPEYHRWENPLNAVINSVRYGKQTICLVDQWLDWGALGSRAPAMAVKSEHGFPQERDRNINLRIVCPFSEFADL